MVSQPRSIYPLFRPSRPDFIETSRKSPRRRPSAQSYCSGLLGRTSLRRDHLKALTGAVKALFRPSRPDFIETPKLSSVTARLSLLFRPSRPDFIETSDSKSVPSDSRFHCSGLLGRTSLRRKGTAAAATRPRSDCSGLLGRTSLRPFSSSL